MVCYAEVEDLHSFPVPESICFSEELPVYVIIVLHISIPQYP